MRFRIRRLLSRLRYRFETHALTHNRKGLISPVHRLRTLGSNHLATLYDATRGAAKKR